MSNRVLIIGASRGLGLGLAKAFHAQGWSVTATVRDRQKAGELAATGVELQTVDIDQLDSVEALAGQLAGRQFEVIFINAGVAGPAHHNPSQASETEIGQLFLTNAFAPVRLAERLLPQLADKGTLVFMSSVLGSIAMGAGNGMPVYGASKAALNHLVRGMYKGMAESGITFLLMHPGWVKTEMGGPEAPLDVPTSAQGMLEQVTRTLGQGGLSFLDYQGKPLPW